MEFDSPEFLDPYFTEGPDVKSEPDPVSDVQASSLAPVHVLGSASDVDLVGALRDDYRATMQPQDAHFSAVHPRSESRSRSRSRSVLLLPRFLI